MSKVGVPRAASQIPLLPSSSCSQMIRCFSPLRDLQLQHCIIDRSLFMYSYLGGRFLPSLTTRWATEATILPPLLARIPFSSKIYEFDYLFSLSMSQCALLDRLLSICHPTELALIFTYDAV